MRWYTKLVRFFKFKNCSCHSVKINKLPKTYSKNNSIDAFVNLASDTMYGYNRYYDFLEKTYIADISKLAHQLDDKVRKYRLLPTKDETKLDNALSLKVLYFE